MADDITLTVRVRDMTRGDFNRLDHQLDRMRRNLRGVSRDGESAGMHSQRLGRDINTLNDRFGRMQRTGSMSRRELTHLRGVLDGMSRSALNAARSGEITHDRYRALNGEIGSLRAQLAHLGRGLDGNTNSLRRNGNQVNHTIRSVNGLVRSINTTTRTVNGNTRHINTWTRDLNNAGHTMNRVSGNGKVMGGAFANIRQRAIGTAVVLGSALLPTIGALAPMIAGLGSVIGVGALAFAGLSKPTKYLTKDEKEFLKALKPVTSEFRNLQATARKAVLPQMSKAFGDASKAVKALNPVMKIAGDTFGQLFGKIARGLASKDFMGPFLQNVKMGTQWLMDFAKSFGTFSIKFFEFGTKSKPALDAWQDLLGGFLDRGLPNMFKSMEQGIGGSSAFLKGLSSLINDSLLPGLGRVFASFMKAFGPMLEGALKTAGKLIDGLSLSFNAVMDGADGIFRTTKDGLSGLAPIMKPIKGVALDVFGAMREQMGIALSVGKDLAKVIGSALIQSFAEVGGIDTSRLNGSLTNFAGWVKENQAAFRHAFISIGEAIIDMVRMGVGALPILVDGFAVLFDMIYNAMGAVIHGMAEMFGSVPGIGDKLKDAATRFDESVGSWKSNLDGLRDKTHEFAEAADRNLSKGKVVLNVQQAKASLEYINHELQNPNLTKERRAKLLVEKAKAEADLRHWRDQLASFNGTKTSAIVEANASPFFGTVRKVRGTKIPGKSASITANPGSFWARVRGLVGRNLGTSYITVQMRRVESTASPRFGASGGKASMLPSKRFADGGSISGGVLRGPGTKTSDGLIARLSRGEFVMQASAVDQYGPDFMSRVNNGTYEEDDDLPGFKKGGMSKKQKAAAKKRAADERSARNSAVGDLTITHFGKMAGYKTDEFKHQLGLPDALKDLVSSLNHWRSVIMKATHGATESNLLKMLDKAGKKLIDYEKKLTKVNASLDKAKSHLDDLKSAAAQLKDNIKTTILGDTNITKAASAEDSQVTINTILSQMQGNAAQATQFDNALKALAAKGVSKDIISQIAQAGISGGGLETANALLGASGSQVSQLNDLETQINKAAGSAGKTAADAMYAAGIRAAEGLVKGLQRQQKAIEDAMMLIAKSMEKSIKKALGIKSPSTVMQEVGHQTAEGFAVGMERNKSPHKAWQSMLTTPPATASRGGGNFSGQPIVIHLSLGGKAVGEIIIDPLRKAIRHRGGDVQAVLGK